MEGQEIHTVQGRWGDGFVSCDVQSPGGMEFKVIKEDKWVGGGAWTRVGHEGGLLC